MIMITTVYAFENIMTCRVHRAVILGLISDGESEITTAFGFSTAISQISMSNDDRVQAEYSLNTRNAVGDQRGQVKPNFYRIYSIGEEGVSGGSTR